MQDKLQDTEMIFGNNVLQLDDVSCSDEKPSTQVAEEGLRPVLWFGTGHLHSC